MSKNNNRLRQTLAVVSSQWFLRFVLLFFVLETAWIALSAGYPMAFDEDFHFGLIRLFAHHISPFWSSQPPGANTFGAVARDPSYLYQYLMSFPYRAVALFTHDQTLIVIILRFINIALFGSGLILYQRVLLYSGASKAIVNSSLLLFILLPITPLLAGQINYDNLLLPLTALALLLTLKLDRALKRKKIDIVIAIELLMVCLVTSLVKYAFLPIFLSIMVFISVRYIQNRRKIASFHTVLAASWSTISSWLKVVLIGGLILISGLFAQRYVVNLVKYHTPNPDCSQVLTIKQCSQYGPWIRDYDDQLSNISRSHSIVTFTKEWFYGMWLRTFFTLGGPTTDYQTRGPLVLPGISAIVYGILGSLAFLISAKNLFKKYEAPALALLFSVSIIYLGFLWFDELKAYISTGYPVAINGRYLLPIMLPLLLLAALGMAHLTRNHQRIKLILFSLAIICMAWGGGSLTFILRSYDNWYWPNNTVKTANHFVQNTIGRITQGYYQPIQFLR